MAFEKRHKNGSCDDENGTAAQNHFFFLIFGADPDGNRIALPRISKYFVLFSNCTIFLLLNCLI